MNFTEQILGFSYPKENKTKCMIAAGIDRMIRDVEQSIAFDDKAFEVVKEFVYIHILYRIPGVSLELQRRIQNANGCYVGCANDWQS
jgi:hypothetical protein